MAIKYMCKYHIKSYSSKQTNIVKFIIIFIPSEKYEVDRDLFAGSLVKKIGRYKVSNWDILETWTSKNRTIELYNVILKDLARS